MFILAEEVLNRALHNLVHEGKVARLGGSPIGCVPPSHLFYADDLVIFCKGTSSSIQASVRLLDVYGTSSGQRINRSKSYLILGKSALHRQSQLTATTCMSVMKLPFEYLGVPLFQGKP